MLGNNDSEKSFGTYLKCLLFISKHQKIFFSDEQSM